MEASLLEDIVEVLGEEGGVDPHAVRAEALRLYLNTHPALKLDGAVALWRKNRISLAKAAEIAGITVPELKEVLATRGIIRDTEGKSRAEMDANLRVSVSTSDLQPPSLNLDVIDHLFDATYLSGHSAG